jgi:hypothetical protein
VIRQCRPVLRCPLMMCGMSDDSRAKGRRPDYVIEQIETVPMTAEQYDQAVNALARLIVEWTTSRRGCDNVTTDHSDGE